MPVVQVVDFQEGQEGWAQVHDPVPDRADITPPVLDPREHPPTNPVTMTVRLEAGFVLGDVTSSYHAIDIDEMGEGHRTIKLAEGAIPADRDFELVWKPKSGAAPQVGLFQERIGGDDYILAMVTPPVVSGSGETPKVETSREVIFVIDNSGSMGGTSIRQAKNGLLFGLVRLRDNDLFNVIRFDDTFDVLFSNSVPADKKNIARARSFVGGLDASGGTEMVAPMVAALRDGDQPDRATLRQVVFLTDGAIGNEKQLLQVIGSHRGRSRVFMVGIGSAPNSYLMSRAAELGRGTFTHIGAMDQVEARMKALFEKLESPVVTQLTAKFDRGKADVTPSMLPDLYRGEPVVLAAKVPSTQGEIEITGLIGDRPWVVKTPIGDAAKGKGISKLWARRKIADAEVQLRLGTFDRDKADARILKLALEHGLVSRLTSLVAVDDAPSRPEGSKLTRADVPLNLPAGWDFDKVFGAKRPQLLERAGLRQRDEFEEARTQDSGDAAARLLKARYEKIAAKTSPQSQASSQNSNLQQFNLPQGATDAELRMIIGVMFVLISMLMFWLAHRGQELVLR